MPTSSTIARGVSHVAAGLAMTVGAAIASAQPFAIDWFTIDGGGGTSTGGNFVLQGTIGQPDAGVMSGGQFTLTGGFWALPVQTGPTCPACAADFDEDGGVTPADVGAFFVAFEAGEVCGDVDLDGGITPADIEAFFFVFEAGGC